MLRQFRRDFFRAAPAIPLFLALASSAGSTGGSGSIGGKVFDAASGAPLPFANVVVLGTARGAITGEDGSYSIAGVAAGACEVQASFIGFATAKASVLVLSPAAVAADFRLQPADVSVVRPARRMVVVGVAHHRCCCTGHRPPRADPALEPAHLAAPAPAAAPAPRPRFALEQNRPNPMNPTTLITIELARQEQASLRIFDLSGRLVRLLVDEMLPAGRHGVIWDGRNGAGEPVSSGAYFFRLEAGKRAETRKLLVLK